MGDATRELLERAAEAGGIVIVRSRLDDPMHRDMLVKNSARNPGQKVGPWNPRDDDGDAMRLSCALGIDILHRRVDHPRVQAVPPHGAVIEEFCSEDDRPRATRWAVVRAAAGMPKKEGKE